MNAVNSYWTQVLLITTNKDHFCNGPIVLTDGKAALVGGNNEGANRFQGDGRRWISVS